MYISAQQILSWNIQYAADRAANNGALTHISADDPRGWIQGPDYVAPVHTLTGVGYAATGEATFGLTDPMTLWAQQQSDSSAVFLGASARFVSSSLTAAPAAGDVSAQNGAPPEARAALGIPQSTVDTMSPAALAPEPETRRAAAASGPGYRDPAARTTPAGDPNTADAQHPRTAVPGPITTPQNDYDRYMKLVEALAAGAARFTPYDEFGEA